MTKFALKVKNNGPSTAPNARVVFSGLEDMTVVGSTPSQGTFDNTVWSIGLVEVGSEAAIEVEVVLPEDVESSLVRAIVSSGVADQNLSNNVVEIIVDASSPEPTGTEWYINPSSNITMINTQDFDQRYHRCDIPAFSFVGNDVSDSVPRMDGTHLIRVGLYKHSEVSNYFAHIPLDEILPFGVDSLRMHWRARTVYWNEDRQSFVLACVVHEASTDNQRAFFVTADITIEGTGVNVSNTSWLEIHGFNEDVANDITYPQFSNDSLLFLLHTQYGSYDLVYIDYSNPDDLRIGSHEYSWWREGRIDQTTRVIKANDPNKKHVYLGTTEWNTCGGPFSGLYSTFSVFDVDSMELIASYAVGYEGIGYHYINAAFNMNNQWRGSHKFGELWGTTNCSVSHICWYDFSQITSPNDMTPEKLLEIQHIVPLDESFNTSNPGEVYWRASESGIIHRSGNSSHLVGLDGSVEELPTGIEYSIILKEHPVSFTDCVVA